MKFFEKIAHVLTAPQRMVAKAISHVVPKKHRKVRRRVKKIA